MTLEINNLWSFFFCWNTNTQTQPELLKIVSPLLTPLISNVCLAHEQINHQVSCLLLQAILMST